MAVLTDEQADRFHRDGFLAVDRLIDDGAVEELRDAYDRIIAREIEAAGDRMLGGVTRQVMIPAAASETFNRNAAIGEAKAVVRRLYGVDDVKRSFDMLIFKPPGHPHDTPWHQDFAYTQRPFAPAGIPTPDEPQSLQFWVPLDDVDVETGCMQFVPGLHRHGSIEHIVASGDPDDEGRLLAIPDPESRLDLSTAVACPIPAGGCTLHHPFTPHYTGPNTSADRLRRAYIVNLAPVA